MHEVAKASSVAFAVLVLSTACLTEIRNWGKFCIQRSACIPPVVQILDRGLRFRFPFETSIHVSDEMVANVITYLWDSSELSIYSKIRKTTHVKLEKVSKFRQLAVQVLINGIKTLLKFLGSQTADWIVGRVVIYVREENGLREGWFDVFS